jgi:hypothetical protein
MERTLYTKIKTEKAPFNITHETPVMMIGSCFSDNIGNILSRNKFNILRNPMGVLYNPASVSNALVRCIDNTPIETKSLVYHNNLWHSFDFHGSFSHADANVVTNNANQSIQTAHNFIKQASVLFVTFGTAWVYKLSQTNKIVANCHKFPASQFTRERLTLESIIKNWDETIKQLKSFNNELKVVFTVSPVKHLKDGAHENQLSKATLLLAIDEIIKTHPENTFYFPSYEIINDELRDYRFYAEDMSHPSDMAVQIIFDKFQETYFEQTTIQLVNDIEKINKAVSHKFLNANTEEINKFAMSILKRIENIEKKHPFINLHSEKNHFKQLTQ